MESPSIFVPIADRPVLEPKEAAALIGCHVNTIYKAIKHDGLQTFTLYRGGNYLIRRADLDKWLEVRANMNAA